MKRYLWVVFLLWGCDEMDFAQSANVTCADNLFTGHVKWATTGYDDTYNIETDDGRFLKIPQQHCTVEYIYGLRQ
jgi:hypothetical protein